MALANDLLLPPPSASGSGGRPFLALSPAAVPAAGSRGPYRRVRLRLGGASPRCVLGTRMDSGVGRWGEGGCRGSCSSGCSVAPVEILLHADDMEISLLLLADRRELLLLLLAGLAGVTVLLLPLLPLLPGGLVGATVLLLLILPLLPAGLVGVTVPLLLILPLLTAGLVGTTVHARRLDSAGGREGGEEAATADGCGMAVAADVLLLEGSTGQLLLLPAGLVGSVELLLLLLLLPPPAGPVDSTWELLLLLLLPSSGRDRLSWLEHATWSRAR